MDYLCAKFDGLNAEETLIGGPMDMIRLIGLFVKIPQVAETGEK